MTRPRTTLTLIAVLLASSTAFADVSDSFNTSLNGWTTVGDSGSTISFLSTGGNPGGFAQIHDAAQGTDDYFVAPAPYLGSKSQFIGGTLSFDLNTQFNVTANDNDILLVGNGVTLSYVFPTRPTGTIWQTFSIKLSPSDPNWHLGNFDSPAPTEANFKTALASISKLQILGDYINGPETNSLDNVLLHSIAIPGDANLDGHVDLTDLSTVLNNFGAITPAWTNGNFDNAPTIDLTDLSTVLNNFGLSAPTPALPTPEPTSLTLLALPTISLLLRRK